MSDTDKTALSNAMAMMREFYVSMVAAGFSENQACVILGTWFAQQAQGGTGDRE